MNKTVSATRTTMTELVLPNDANTHGNVLGGKVMHLLDLAGAIAAYRHCRKPVVTASVDSVQFLHPVKVGELMILHAVVNRVFTTSMEVQVEVESEDPLSGRRTRTCSAYLTFVAVEEGKPVKIPPIVPETAEEKKNYEKAEQRRQARLHLARS